jgi:uncharacterized protein (DUF983 family)
MNLVEEQNTLSLKTVLKRGWRKKCPRCGQGQIFKKFLTLHDECSNCGLVYLPDQGDLLGPMIFIDRVVFLIPMVTIFCFCVPHASPLVYIPTGALMTFLLVYTMPNRNGVCLAVDYYLRYIRKV